MGTQTDTKFQDVIIEAKNASCRAYTACTGVVVMKLIEIKTVNPYFTDTWNGDKPVEIRFNDRDYQEGDLLWQREYDPEEAREGSGTGYSGREILSLVSKILIKEDVFAGLSKGYLMMGIKILLKRKSGSGQWASISA